MQAFYLACQSLDVQDRASNHVADLETILPKMSARMIAQLRNGLRMSVPGAQRTFGFKGYYRGVIREHPNKYVKRLI